MAKLTKLVTDTYQRKARLYPALLLVAPVIGTAVAFLSANISLLKYIASAFAALGGLFLLAQLARDAGKKEEGKLFASWGGVPSVNIFRHRDDRLDPITKARYHSKLSKLVSGAKAPTSAREIADPAAADKIYSAWSNFLRTKTRDTKKYALLFQENISYGYRRNVAGMRRFGITVSVVCIALDTIRLVFLYRASGEINEAWSGALFLSLIFLALWTFRFTNDWVQVPANAYAERLAEAVDSL